jgi:hypothetical protein
LINLVTAEGPAPHGDFHGHGVKALITRKSCSKRRIEAQTMLLRSTEKVSFS